MSALPDKDTAPDLTLAAELGILLSKVFQVSLVQRIKGEIDAIKKRQPLQVAACSSDAMKNLGTPFRGSASMPLFARPRYADESG